MKFKVLYFASLLVFWFAACQQSAPKSPKPSPAEQGMSSANQENLVWAGDQDPVCEMKIDQSAEDTLHFGGKVYGFCGPNCKEKFQENPAKYVGK